MILLLNLLHLIFTTTLGRADVKSCAPTPDLASIGRAVEVEARTKAGDLCPNERADATDAVKTVLLDRIRTQSLVRMKTVSSDLDASSDADVLKRFDSMRHLLALRRADVQASAPLILIINYIN